MKATLHHTHLFSSDIDTSLRFYQDMFGAEVVFDREMAGARNVMISIGSGKINFYDQPPEENTRGVMHHIGIETDDLETLIRHMKNKGFNFKKTIQDHGSWKYVMVEAPDKVLLELFQMVRDEFSKNQSVPFSSLHL